MKKKGGDKTMKKFLASLAIVFGIAGLITITSDSADAKKSTSPSIVDIVLADDGEFDVLQAAVVKAGLVEALNGRKTYTVFAPTDQAFINALGAADEADAISIIKSKKKSEVQNILLNHVTNGQRNSTSVLGAPTYKMINGDKLTRSEIVEAGIAQTDIQARNGIVHVINGVLLP